MRRIVLDPRGLAAIARSHGMAEALNEAGDAVRDNVERMGIRVEHEPGDIALPVEVEGGDLDGTTASFVTLAHPAGEAVQAKHGALTKGAAQAGLDVRAG